MIRKVTRASNYLSKPSKTVPISDITYAPPKGADAQNKLAQEMVEWAINDPNALCIDSFPVMKKFSPARFYYIARVNDKFSDALDLAKAAIGARLVHLWKEKKVEKDFCLRLLPLYSKEYAEYIKSKIYESSKGKAEGSNFTVLMEQIKEMPNFPILPEVTD